MLALAVSHQIFLSREERYDLAYGKEVEVIGVSVPVWFYKGNTSEPANEVFCRYVLTNRAKDYPVSSLACGYQINVPQGVRVGKRLPPSEWDVMSVAEKNLWLRKNAVPATGADLLDPADGGVNHLRFKRYNRIKENGKRMNQIHVIDISPIERLESSLV